LSAFTWTWISVVYCDREGLIRSVQDSFTSFTLHIFGAQAGKAAQEFGAEFAGKPLRWQLIVVAKANFGLWRAGSDENAG